MIKALSISLLIVFSFLELSAQRNKDKSEELSYPDKKRFEQNYFNGLREKTIGNYELAADYFSKALDINMHSDEVFYELAIVNEELGKLDLALEFIREAKTINSKNEWYLILEADIYEGRNEYAKAAKVYEELTKSDPDKIEYFFDFAAMLLYTNKLQDAVDVYNLIEDKIGLNEDISIQKQKIYVKLDKVDKAINEAKRLVEAFPMEVRYLAMLGELYDANERKKDAQKVYEQILEIDPDYAYARLTLADYYKEAGELEKSFEEIRLAFASQGLDIDNKVRILLAYMSLLDQQQYRENALLLGKILIETHPNEAKANSIYGDVLYECGQVNEARNQYLEAVDKDNSRFIIWQRIVEIDAEIDNIENLIMDSEKALEFYPNQGILYFYSGYANIRARKYDEAISVLNSGLSVAGNNEGLKSGIYAQLGEAYHNLRKFVESDQAFENTLKLNPNDANTLNNYAYYLSLRNEKLKRAKEMSMKSNTLVPNNGSYQDTYGWILYQLKDFEGAKEWLLKAIKNGGSSSATVLEHYGDVLYQLGKVDEAFDYWIKAKENGEGTDSLVRKIADKKLYE